MTKEFKLPNMGENIVSAEIIKILVAVGDKVEKEQSVLEISSDKATLEVPVDFSGTIKSISIKEGDSVAEGQTIFVIDEEGVSEPVKIDAKKTETQEVKGVKVAETKQTKTVEPIAAEQKVAKISFNLPNMGENIASAEIIKILVAVGDKVEKEQSVLEISSDKATLEIPSNVSGTVTEINVKEGDSVTEGQQILALDGFESVTPQKVETPIKQKSEELVQEKKSKFVENAEIITNAIVQQKNIQNTTSQISRTKDVAPAAPSVRRFAREIGLDINNIPGSGENGRISMEDVKDYSKNLNTNPVVNNNSSSNGYTENLPDFSKWGEVSSEPMNNIRFKTAQHLHFAWNIIPHVTHFEKVDITDLEKLRKQYAKKVEAMGGKLTMTSILIKIMSSALKVFPKFNASIDMDKKEVIYKKYFHIGLAVDTDRGLLVPVIKDADKKNVTQISIEVSQVAEKAKAKKITVDDMQGATFTISNLGGIGGVNFTPVVNHPEVAILGVSKSSYEPVYIDEVFQPRLIMPLSLSYDHRLIDGADAARFMKWVKDAIENPFLIMLEG
ncbi:MAG: 2-oxo acid dehydrogenase subunit E2 [Candidatus Sericytochromatia bacterium]|nr:2-oxo acid dehydrogenase subunit E2 [Candidatus Sericytochromatia bacterium]